MEENNNNITGVKYDDSKIEGLGGWLIFIAIGLIISPLALLINMSRYSNLKAYPGYFEEISKFNSLLPVLMKYVGLFSVVALVYAIVLIVTFFLKKKIFVKLKILHFCIDVVYSVVLIFAFRGMASGIMSAMYFQIITSIFFGALWVWYLLKSERVKNTFVN